MKKKYTYPEIEIMHLDAKLLNDPMGFDINQSNGIPQESGRAPERKVF